MKHMVLMALLLCAGLMYAQPRGIVKESVVLKSSILSKDVKYNIYLPAGYNESARSYPVLYLLHGATDNETAWTQFGEDDRIADKEIAEGSAAPMIIVTPDAGLTWYINNYDNSVRYEDFFVQELIPHIDATYRTRADKSFRAVAGLSMGGYGSFIMALKHPDLFAACAPLSAGVITDDETVKMDAGGWGWVFGIPFNKELKGKDRLTEHYYNNSVLKLIEKGNADKMKQVRYYIDCGDDDFLIKGNMAVHSALLDKQIPHEFRVRDGAHTWKYWREALPEVLKFVSESFHR